MKPLTAEWVRKAEEDDAGAVQMERRTAATPAEAQLAMTNCTSFRRLARQSLGLDPEPGAHPEFRVREQPARYQTRRSRSKHKP